MNSIVSVEEKYITVFDGFECLLILWWGFRFVEIPMFYLVSSKISIHYLLKKKHTIKFQREKKKNLSTLNSSCNKCHEANSRNKREKGVQVHTCMELYLGLNNYQSPKIISVCQSWAEEVSAVSLEPNQLLFSLELAQIWIS